MSVCLMWSIQNIFKHLKYIRNEIKSVIIYICHEVLEFVIIFLDIKNQF